MQHIKYGIILAISMLSSVTAMHAMEDNKMTPDATKVVKAKKKTTKVVEKKENKEDKPVKQEEKKDTPKAEVAKEAQQQAQPEVETKPVQVVEQPKEASAPVAKEEAKTETPKEIAQQTQPKVEPKTAQIVEQPKEASAPVAKEEPKTETPKEIAQQTQPKVEPKTAQVVEQPKETPVQIAKEEPKKADVKDTVNPVQPTAQTPATPADNSKVNLEQKSNLQKELEKKTAEKKETKVEIKEDKKDAQKTALQKLWALVWWLPTKAWNALPSFGKNTEVAEKVTVEEVESILNDIKLQNEFFGKVLNNEEVKKIQEKLAQIRKDSVEGKITEDNIEKEVAELLKRATKVPTLAQEIKINKLASFYNLLAHKQRKIEAENIEEAKQEWAKMQKDCLDAQNFLAAGDLSKGLKLMNATIAKFNELEKKQSSKITTRDKNNMKKLAKEVQSESVFGQFIKGFANAVVNAPQAIANQLTQDNNNLMHS